MPSPLDDARGLLVTGTQPRCGKTVACAGLAGALNQLGFKAQAIKPLSFLPKVSLKEGQEQAFFDRIIPPIEHMAPLVTESAHTLTPTEWQRVIENCRKRVYPYILEAPGSIASPIRYVQDEILDAVDLAQALKIPILLVIPKQADLIAALAPVLTYCWQRSAEPIGWISVETGPPPSHDWTPHWDAEVLYLTHHYNIPYLGDIAYSPSISVEALQQGNLLRTTEMGVDLLPIQKALDLLVP